MGHGIQIVFRGGAHLLASGDLVYLGHKDLVGNGLVPHEGEGGVHGPFHVYLQADTDGGAFHSFLLGLFLLFLGDLGGLHIGIHGVVVLFLHRRCGGGLDVYPRSGVYGGPVGDQQIHDQRLPVQLFLHGSLGLFPGHAAYVHAVDDGAGQHAVANDDGFDLLLLSFGDQVHLRRTYDDIGFRQRSGGGGRRHGAVRYGFGKLRTVPVQQDGAKTACQDQYAGTGTENPILLFSAKFAHRALLLTCYHCIGFPRDCHTFYPCFTTKLQICDV